MSPREAMIFRAWFSCHENTTGDVAMMLGISSNAVVGTINRMRMKYPEANALRPKLPPNGDRPRRPAQRRSKQIEATEVVYVRQFSAPPGRFDGCQWIEGQPTEDDSCKCMRPLRSGAYCAEHAAIAWRVSA